jgi:hypothetical protein
MTPPRLLQARTKGVEVRVQNRVPSHETNEMLPREHGGGFALPGFDFLYRYRKRDGVGRAVENPAFPIILHPARLPTSGKDGHCCIEIRWSKILMESHRRDPVVLDWSLALMTRAFRDLATSFAAVDRDRADASVRHIETTLGGELADILRKPPEGVSVETLRFAIEEAARPFREMTQGALELIQHAGDAKP